MTRDQLLEKLLISYSGSYDIDRLEQPDPNGLAATAHFHVEETSYMISQKAQMWSTESDEYVWFFSMPTLTDELCQRCIQYAYDQGMAKIDPNGPNNHMVTRLVAIFLHDGAEEAAETRVKKCRLYKSFQFSLKGWMEFHAVAVDLGKESVTANGYGRETAKFLKNLLHPVKKDGRGKRLLGIFKEMLH